MDSEVKRRNFDIAPPKPKIKGPKKTYFVAGDRPPLRSCYVNPPPPTCSINIEQHSTHLLDVENIKALFHRDCAFNAASRIQAARLAAEHDGVRTLERRHPFASG